MRPARVEDIALIQYTSGSTGDPKGVVLTQGNVMANIRAIGAGLKVQSTDKAVSWLPLYHDMGLIGSWLAALYFGVPIAILSPLAFLSRPERWLWAIHHHRATISPAPNFAYELCARRIDERAIEGLDLSCWRAALNGAEPVSPDTLEPIYGTIQALWVLTECIFACLWACGIISCIDLPSTGQARLGSTGSRENDFNMKVLLNPANLLIPRSLRFVSVGRALAWTRDPNRG